MFNVAQEAGTLAVQGHLDRRPSFSDRVVSPEQDVGMLNFECRVVSTSYLHDPFIQGPVWVSRYTYLFIHFLQLHSRKRKGEICGLTAGSPKNCRRSEMFIFFIEFEQHF